MKLSKLVAHLNNLDSMQSLSMQEHVRLALLPQVHVIKNHEIKFPDLFQQLEQDYENIQTHIDLFSQRIQQIKQEIKTLVEQQEHHYFAESYKLYEAMMEQDSNEYILQRRPALSEESRNFIDGRIRRHGDWHHCGMILRPGQEDFLTSLVALDPLYVVDVDHELMEPFVNSFNPVYRTRLRTYAVQESIDANMFDQIPNNQFAFVLAYNYFNYKPLELIRRILQEIYAKLKPGGTLAFTFNDCDRYGAVELVERSFMCYTPGRLLLSAAEAMGYEIKQTFIIDSACTWVEISKPGTLTSLRGGQSLAKLVAKSK